MSSKRVWVVPFVVACSLLGCAAPEPEAPPATPEPTPEPAAESYALAAPILEGQEQAWRDVVAQITGERAEAHRTAYEELGVTKELVWLQETPEGSMAVVYLEGSDLDTLFQRELASEDDHVEWFLEQLETIHGFDPEAPPPPNELVFRGDVPGVEGATHPYALAAPILEGKREAFDTFIAALDERQEAWEESRRAKGIAKEYVWLQEAPAGSMAVVYFETTSPEGPQGLMAESDLEFDPWFQEHITDIHGIQPGDPLPQNERMK